MIGSRIGEYEILEHIASGGMAEVYKAIESVSGQLYAIKVLPPEYARDAKMLARFNREITNVRRLDHPNIVKIYEDGQADDICYFVMDFVDGENLAALVERKGVLSLGRALRIFAQICKALKYSHKRGIIHRDIKPANILIDRKGVVTVTDFGIARMKEDERLTTTGAGMGTPEYISPEQAKGSALDQRSDIYSLGVVLYHMVTGKVPFTADTPIAVVMQHIHAEPPTPKAHNPEIPDWLEAAILKMLAKEPEQRYQNISALMRAFKHELRRQPQDDSQGRRTPDTDIGEKKQSLVPLIVLLAVLSALYIAGVGVVFYRTASAKNRAVEGNVKGYDFTEYHPLEIGDTWNYVLHNGSRLSRTVTGTDNVCGKSCYRMESSNGEVSWWTIDRTGAWLLKVQNPDGTAGEFCTDEPLMAGSIPVGYSKTTQFENCAVYAPESMRIGTAHGSIRCSFDSVEDVTTPAGTFENCVHGTLVISSSTHLHVWEMETTGTETIETWFAKGIGSVKQIRSNGETLVLESAIIDGRSYPAVKSEKNLATN
ncbi:MAG: serine/threonine protein kinase [Candidatus Abyssobacteria bacterium SURF_17]|uniref:non-specific serine/threonine protein kinase n=1 Tax=Candidatus Abyssobacteria bacterium SURF_17 TaxID=2093361 RepID=A0A419EQ18_9BACT|nr:MAG: serine/threonine protein kinase [Candidatus Abyssubacteria bacterium SURF_17]